MKTDNIFNMIEISFISFISGIMFLALLSNSTPQTQPQTDRIHTLYTQSIMEEDTFSEKALFDYLVQLNIKHPHIVLAQSKLETGNFTSLVFKENNNLFGMKEAKVRVTTNMGTKNGHAVYDNWKNSVIDYALWQSSYLYHAKSEDVYYDYLSSNYAQDPNYIKKVKQISQKVKSKYGNDEYNV